MDANADSAASAQDVLPLVPLDPRLPPGAPFTRAMARRAEVSDHAVTRMLRAGLLRRVLRGVYIDATAPETQRLRADALRLVLPEDATRVVVTGRTAAWLHGVDLPRAEPDLPVPVEWHRPAGRLATRAASRVGGRRVFGDRDVTTLEGVRVTTPLRTALDLGRTLPEDRALAALDGLMRAGGLSHGELLAELPRFTGQSGSPQLRRLACQADPRAVEPAESVLRLRWHQAELPTPVPGLTVQADGRIVRVALAVPPRRFGACLGDQLSAAEQRAVAEAGWRVVQLDRRKVLRSDPLVVRRHLESEFRRLLLDQVALPGGGSAAG